MRRTRWNAIVGAVLGCCLGCWALDAIPEARAQDAEKGAFGLGIILGEPTGVTAKLYLNNDTAVAAAVGSAFISGGLHLHADYLVHPWLLEDSEYFVLPAYLGGGIRVLQQLTDTGATFHLGLRAVGGILFDFTEIPIDVFAEVAGVLDYAFSETGGFGFAINAGLGARYYF